MRITQPTTAEVGPRNEGRPLYPCRQAQTSDVDSRRVVDGSRRASHRAALLPTPTLCAAVVMVVAEEPVRAVASCLDAFSLGHTVNTFRVPVNTLYCRPMDEQLIRPQVPELDAILGFEIPVLDDGFVRVVDYMGDDAAIVQAARIPYGADTTTRMDNAIQIRYLMQRRITKPFETCLIKLHLRMPMDCWSQWISRMTGMQRQDLPIAAHAETYWTINLQDLFGFLDIRANSHLQAELRAYAKAIAAHIVARWVPAAYVAFCDFRLDSMTLSCTERDVFSALVQGDTEHCLELALAAGWVDAKGKPAGRNRERDECDQKLAILGLGAPWND